MRIVHLLRNDPYLTNSLVALALNFVQSLLDRALKLAGVFECGVHSRLKFDTYRKIRVFNTPIKIAAAIFELRIANR